MKCVYDVSFRRSAVMFVANCVCQTNITAKIQMLFISEQCILFNPSISVVTFYIKWVTFLNLTLFSNAFSVSLCLILSASATDEAARSSVISVIDLNTYSLQHMYPYCLMNDQLCCLQTCLCCYGRGCLTSNQLLINEHAIPLRINGAICTQRCISIAHMTNMTRTSQDR